MLWLADECVAASLVRELRGTGHDVLYVAEFAASMADPDIIALALREGRLLLTADKDFGELVFRRGQAVPGVVLMRTDPKDMELARSQLQHAINHFGAALFGRYVVIDGVRLRSRSL